LGDGVIPKRSIIGIAGLVTLICLLAGCGRVEPGADSGAAAIEKPENPPAKSSTPSKASRRDKKEPDPVQVATVENDPHRAKPRSLADLLETRDTDYKWIPGLSPMKIDEARAAAAGIRKLTGDRLTLFTDLPPDPKVDILPEVFDRAFGQWCEYFNVDEGEQDDWRMTGFLMRDAQPFVDTGLLPQTLPPFGHGYSRNDMLWLYEQPSPYYRRHLLLHEGTHGFMNTVFGSCGPPWYAEGMAELLATHRWHDGQLTMNWTPTSREEVPMWGRIKVVKDAVAENRVPSLKDVIEYNVNAHRQVEPYAWCWAAATLLDRHPRYRERFRGLYRLVNKSHFSDRFIDLLGDDWDALSEQWRVFVVNLEYGHDVPKTVLDFSPGKPISGSKADATVAADRGWQNTGLRLEAGTTYRLTAQGRYQIAEEPRTWWCEPGGVSIRYYRGLPLGILMAAVRPDEPPENGPRPLVRPVAIGLEATLTPEKTGTLHLRINDSPGELHDNRGSLSVEIRTDVAKDMGPIDNQGPER
jgi:hypothetical protein